MSLTCMFWPEDFNPFLMTNCNCMCVPCFITYIVLTPSNVFFYFYFLDCSLCVHVVLMIWNASSVITVHWCHSEKLEWARNTVTVLHQTAESTELHCSLWDSAQMYDLLLKPSVWNHYYFTMILYACWSFWKKFVKTALIWLFGRSMRAICGSSWTWRVNVTPPQTYDVKHTVLFLKMCSWCCVFEQNQTDSPKETALR